MIIPPLSSSYQLQLSSVLSCQKPRHALSTGELPAAWSVLATFTAPIVCLN
jgi:hypothetical protein